MGCALAHRGRVDRGGYQPFMVRQLRIVIVDDNDQTRRAIATLLSFVDEVQIVGEAADGVEAIEQCRRAGPDCVLMDVNMPRMDGLAAARRLRAEQPDVTVIMMSVDDTPAIRRAVASVGVRHFLVKPLSLDVLMGVLRTVSIRSQISV